MATATQMSRVPAEANDESQEPKYLYRVFLAMPHQPLPKVIEWTRIAVWGPRMYDRVKLEMWFYAWMLTAVAMFDFAAWSLLFNQILTSGSFHWVFSPVAMVLGSGMAFLLFKYERQVVIYDISRGKKRLFSAFGFRCVMVALAALLTSQPVELFLFREPIAHRIHEESVRLEALNRQYYLTLMEQKQQKEIRRQEKEIDDLTAEIRNAIGQHASSQGKLSGANAGLSLAQKTLIDHKEELKKCSTPAECEKVRKKIEQDGDNIKQLSGQVSTFTSKVTAQTSVLEDTRKEKDTALKNGQAIFSNALEQEQNRVQDWIHRLRTSPELKDVEYELPNKQGWQFNDSDYDFIQKLRVLEDLTAGRPPRWPQATEDDVISLSAKYKLNDIGVDQLQSFRNKNQSAGTEQRPKTFLEESRSSEVTFFRAAYRIVFGIAIIIPLMSFGFKLLMPQELADYYSVRFQDKMGNPQARSYLEQKKELEAEDQAAFENAEISHVPQEQALQVEV